MSQPELLARIVEALRRLEIPFMVTGSIASSLQGEPRSTHDIDLVVVLPTDLVPDLAAAFPEPDYYLDPESAREAVREERSFNLIDLATGDKVDFWLLTDSAFDRSRFQRRTPAHIGNLEFDVSSPEDTIIQKLHWARESGGSEKQFVDALRVFEVQRQLLDMDYIEQWVQTLKLVDSWTSLQARARSL